MAYQNVGRPRFIIDWLQWWQSLGLLYPDNIWNSEQDEEINKVVGLNPTYQSEVSDIGNDSTTAGINWTMGTRAVFPVNDVRIVGLLGHNFASLGGNAYVSFSYYDGIDWPYLILTDDILINAGGNQQALTCPYNGFSFRSCNGTSKESLPIVDEDSIVPNIRDIANHEYATVKLGAMLMGSYYDMPHSPDLKLTMTREMDGVKRIRTKGGSDLINRKYTKPTSWGDLGAWELGGSPKLSRIGRRIWNLSFSYLQDSDVFPEVSNLTTHGASTPEGYSLPYYSDYEMAPMEWGLLQQNGWGNDNFYGDVIHKTNGGQLPFIFQPDSSNYNPDGFAICKFDMNTFKFKQVANGVYNVKVKIREVW